VVVATRELALPRRRKVPHKAMEIGREEIASKKSSQMVAAVW
jgi:hypothetical protein